MKRTYYCVEMVMPSYPVGELRISTRPPTDPITREHCHRVRAESVLEAEEKVRDRLNTERHAACVEQLG